MERITSETIINTVFGALLGAVVGAAGASHLESESMKLQFLARNEYLELYGSCARLSSFTLPRSDYLPVVAAEIEGFSFYTAVHRERVVNEAKKQIKTPAWTVSPSVMKTALPGLAHITSEISVDAIMPKQIIEGDLFCPTIAVQEIKSRILGIFPTPNYSKPSHDEIFRGVKET